MRILNLFGEEGIFYCADNKSKDFLSFFELLTLRRNIAFYEFVVENLNKKNNSYFISRSAYKKNVLQCLNLRTDGLRAFESVDYHNSYLKYIVGTEAALCLYSILKRKFGEYWYLSKECSQYLLDEWNEFKNKSYIDFLEKYNLKIDDKLIHSKLFFTANT